MAATEQEIFWRGAFGDSYIDRNNDPRFVATDAAFFNRVLNRTRNICSVLELGSNIGLNLMAIKQLLPNAQLSAVEINEKAAAGLKMNLPEVNLHLGSILDFQPESVWDFVFTKGVLIHINPEKVHVVYDLVYRCSSHYIMLSEYYNPKPVEVLYRGYTGKLFKRDFAGEMLDQYPDVSLLDYGFAYHRDPNFPQDDMTWFLLEKK